MSRLSHKAAPAGQLRRRASSNFTQRELAGTESAVESIWTRVFAFTRKPAETSRERRPAPEKGRAPHLPPEPYGGCILPRSKKLTIESLAETQP
jgi:hypothetical protein